MLVCLMELRTLYTNLSFMCNTIFIHYILFVTQKYQQKINETLLRNLKANTMQQY